MTLAHDGRNLWSYDAAQGLYRNLGEGPESQTEQFKVSADVVLTEMRWHKGELWAWDAKGRQVLALRQDGRMFEISQAAPLPDVTGTAQSFLLTCRANKEKVQELQLWALTTDPAGEPLLKKYTVRR